jgi:hypothetical protein
MPKQYSEINGFIERLDQGHHNPPIEVLRLICPGRELNPGLRGGKELLEQPVYSYSEHLQYMSLRHGSQRCMCYMNTHEKH